MSVYDLLFTRRGVKVGVLQTTREGSHTPKGITNLALRSTNAALPPHSAVRLSLTVERSFFLYEAVPQTG